MPSPPRLPDQSPAPHRSRAALQHAIETVLLAYNRTVAERLAASGLVTIHADTDVFWFLAHETALSMLNSASAFQWRWDEADARIAAIVAAAAGVPMLWWTGPATQPPDLGERLLAHGFQPGQVIGGMALPLAQLPEPSPGPAGLTFEPVTTPQGVAAAVGVIDAALGGAPPGLHRALIALGESTLPAPARLRLVLACREGVPLGVTWLMLAEGVAGLFHSTVLPDQRRQGLGTALVAAALHQARAEGCDLGVILAGRQQQGVARALGFAEYGVFLQYFSPVL
ncbi:MAG: GNAT family N-acetyltransferase [Anaerolineae bacterium]|nr:GNAT family N-acetyltransferase [Anaerolineae bacterium]